MKIIIKVYEQLKSVIGIYNHLGYPDDNQRSYRSGLATIANGLLFGTVFRAWNAYYYQEISLNLISLFIFPLRLNIILYSRICKSWTYDRGCIWRFCTFSRYCIDFILFRQCYHLLLADLYRCLLNQSEVQGEASTSNFFATMTTACDCQPRDFYVILMLVFLAATLCIHVIIAMIVIHKTRKHKHRIMDRDSQWFPRGNESDTSGITYTNIMNMDSVWADDCL